MIATPEKAITDLLVCHSVEVENKDELRRLLAEGYRIERESLKRLRLEQIEEVTSGYPSLTLSYLPSIIREVKQNA